MVQVNSFHAQLPVMLAYLSVQAIGITVGLWLDKKGMVNLLRILSMMLFLIFSMLSIHLVSMRLTVPDISSARFFLDHYQESMATAILAVMGTVFWYRADDFDL